MTPHEEKELVEFLIECAQIGFATTRKHVMTLFCLCCNDEKREEGKEKTRVQPQRNKRRVLRDETDSEMMLTLYDLLVNVTVHKQQSGCVVMFVEGGGTVCVQASAINLLPRRTMFSPVATALITFCTLFCFVFALFFESTFVVLRKIVFTCCTCSKYFLLFFILCFRIIAFLYCAIAFQWFSSTN